MERYLQIYAVMIFWMNSIRNSSYMKFISYMKWESYVKLFTLLEIHAVLWNEIFIEVYGMDAMKWSSYLGDSVCVWEWHKLSWIKEFVNFMSWV